MNGHWKYGAGAIYSAALLTLGLSGFAFADEPLWDVPAASSLARATPSPTVNVARPSLIEAVEHAENNYWSGSTLSADNCAPPRWWFTTDYLLLWTNGNPVPPLLTTNLSVPPRSEAGVLDVGDTQVVVGERVDESARSGVALSTGLWLDDCRSSGLVVSWWYAGDAADELNDVWTSSGVPVLARPFLNAGSGLEDSQLVAYPNVVEGSIRVATGSDLRSFESLIVTNWSVGCRSRFDLLGGYRYFRFREGILVNESLVSTDPGGLVPVGTMIDLFDRFDISNSFHGATLGAMASFEHGCYQLDVTTKLAFGNVRRRSMIGGATMVTTPGGGQATTQGGLLALASNIGSRKDDAFGLLPELNVTGRVLLTDHLTLNLGYNLMFLTNVYRAGKQIDRTIDPGLLSGVMPINSNVPNGLIHPARQADSSTLAVQGLNLGCTFSY